MKPFPGSPWSAYLLSRRGEYGLPSYGQDVTFVLWSQGVPVRSSSPLTISSVKDSFSFSSATRYPEPIRGTADFRWNNFFTLHRLNRRIRIYVTRLPSGMWQYSFGAGDRPLSFYFQDWGRSLASFRKKRRHPFPRSFGNSYLPGTVSHLTPYIRSVSDDCFPPKVETQLSYTNYQRTWTGVRTPNFASLKGKNLPVNPHSVNLILTSNPIGVKAFYQPEPSSCGPERWYVEEDKSTNMLGGMEPAGPSHDAANVNKALQRLTARANAGLLANNAQNLAQFGQFVRLVGNNAARITGAVRNLRRGNIPGAINSLWQGKQPQYRPNGGPSRSKTLAQNWLELQYGWKPLLSDIDGSLKAIHKFNYGGYVIQQARASATSTSTVVSNVLDWGAFPCGKRTIRTRSTTKYGLRFVLDDHLQALLAQTGFSNPLNLAWEVLPFSFVVDWFLPIGPYLEALQAFRGYKFLGGFQVQFTKQEVFSGGFSHYPPDHFSPGSDEIWNAGTFSRTWVIFGRAKLTSFPTPEFPQLKNPFSATHALNALALMKQVFGK